MKNMRKIASLLLALVMIFGLATTAFADGTNTITVNDTVDNETYTLYKMMNLRVDDPTNPTAYSYTVADTWNNFFTGTGAGASYVTISATDSAVTWKDDMKSADLMILFGQAAAAYAENLTGFELEGNGEAITFTGLDAGYYLITSTLGTKAIVDTTPTNPNRTITEKNPEDTITKTVKEDSTGNYGSSNDAQIGDTIEFMSVATLNPYTTNVKIHDTMESGLTFNENSVVVGDLEQGADKDYTLVVSPEDGHTFDIIFTDSYLNSLTVSTELTITYSAVLNENAVANNAIADQTNTIQITYGDKQSVETETTTTTHKFSVFKHAANSTDNLADAIFSLKKNGTVVNLIKIDENNYRVAKTGEAGTATFTTVANGDIVIWGVDADNDYALEETAAPEGYNKLGAEVKVAVNADNSTRIDIENNAGTELPSTGGMGTTLFYVFGGILVVGAVVLLVTKKRMSAE